jgi:hypothetical protein
MNQLEIRSSTTYRAEIFTRGVSHQDHSSLKISAQKDQPKWEIVSEGGAGPLSIYQQGEEGDGALKHLPTFKILQICHFNMFFFKFEKKKFLKILFIVFLKTWFSTRKMEITPSQFEL